MAVASSTALAADAASQDTTLSWMWWFFLVCAAVVNLTLYARQVRQRAVDDEQARRRRMMARLALPYVFQIAWRSALPSEYPTRRTFFDMPANSAMLARMLAAIGETCFAAELATAISWVSIDMEVYFETGKEGTSTQSLNAPLHMAGRGASKLMVLLVVVGQCCATTGTATRNQFWFLMEGILWSVLFTITTLVGGFLWAESRRINMIAESSGYVFLRSLCIGSALALSYMSLGYCPMCYGSWRADEAAKASYYSLGEGFRDAFVNRVPSRAWAGVWEFEWLWMTLYFVFGGWSSTWLVRAPEILPPNLLAPGKDE